MAPVSLEPGRQGRLRAQGQGTPAPEHGKGLQGEVTKEAGASSSLGKLSLETQEGVSSLCQHHPPNPTSTLASPHSKHGLRLLPDAIQVHGGSCGEQEGADGGRWQVHAQGRWEAQA